MIIYNGRDDTKPAHVGLGEHAIKSLVSVVDNPEQHEFYFDRFFTSYELMSELAKADVCATFTIRLNSIKRCPLHYEKKLKKDDRGVFDYYNDNLVLIC